LRVVGTTTAFLSKYANGDYILINNQTRKIDRIIGNFQLDVTVPFTQTATAQSVYRIRDFIDVSVESGNNYIVGSGSAFDLVFKANDEIMIFNQKRTIDSVIDRTTMNVTQPFVVSASNTEIGLYNLYALGGQGYERNSLPSVTIETTTGIGANLTASAFMGNGEDLRLVAEKQQGAIEEVEIYEFGLGYRSAPAIDMSESGSGTARLRATIGTSIFSYPGKFITTDGHLSSDKLLQDSYLFNTGTYILKTAQEFSRYKQALEKLLHPSGTLTFAEFIPVETNQTSNNSAYLPVIKARKNPVYDFSTSIEITTN
jgi:hypothetical protein